MRGTGWGGAITRIAGSRTARITAAVIAGAAIAVLGLLAAATPATTSGYTAKVTNADTALTAQYFTCASAYAADRSTAIFQYPLNETISLLGAADVGTALGLNGGTYRGSFATSTTTPLACPRDTGGAYVLNGSTSFVTSALASNNPTTFSVEVWFKATALGGKLIGMGNSQTGSSTQYDRHIYIDSNGKLVFGSYNGGVQVVTSTNTVTLNTWHYAVGTMSASTGMKLYLDNVLVASNAAYTVPEVNTTGYWHIGFDNLSGWPNPPANNFFTGQMRWAAAYTSVLSTTQISNHWFAGQ